MCNELMIRDSIKSVSLVRSSLLIFGFFLTIQAFKFSLISCSVFIIQKPRSKFRFFVSIEDLLWMLFGDALLPPDFQKLSQPTHRALPSPHPRRYQDCSTLSKSSDNRL